MNRKFVPRGFYFEVLTAESESGVKNWKFKRVDHDFWNFFGLFFTFFVFSITHFGFCID